MARSSVTLRLLIMLVSVAAGVLFALPPPASAQEEVASAIRRYKDRETSTGYYEEYEVRPRRQRPFVEVPGVQVGLFPYSPSAAEVRVRTRLADSHMGIAFYADKTCAACHPRRGQRHPHGACQPDLPAVSWRGTHCQHPILQFTHEPDPEACVCVRQVPRGLQRLVCKLHHTRTRAGLGCGPKEFPRPLLSFIGS